MNQQFEQLFQSTSLKQHADKLSQALKGGGQARLELALSLAEAEYNHPECEKAASKPNRRSFCLHHQKNTDKAFLLIHGFTACPYEMRELGEILHRQGYNVFGLRLAGHGTNVADFSKYKAADWVSSAKQGLAISSLMGRRTIVIGESLGGALAALLARDYPDLVGRLILCAPAFRFVNRLAYLSKWRMIQKIIPQNDMGVQYDWQRPYWYDIIPTSSIAELVKIANEGRKSGSKIKVSTLIIHAVNDQIIRFQGSRAFYNNLPQLTAVNKKLILFPNGHHNLTIELNPRKAQVFNWINDFI